MLQPSIIFGTSSGIGRSLVELHIEQGLPVVAVSHNASILSEQLKDARDVTVVELDLLSGAHIEDDLDNIFSDHSEIGIVYLVFGTGFLNPELKSNSALATLELNCKGFTRVALSAARTFKKNGAGHLVAITSVAAIRGSSAAPSYNASKAYQSSFLEGLRCHFHNEGLPIHVTEIRAGFVDTEMMKTDRPFWVSPPRKAAEQIFSAAKQGKSIVYVTKRWRIIGVLLGWMPRFVYNRIG